MTLSALSAWASLGKWEKYSVIAGSGLIISAAIMAVRSDKNIRNNNLESSLSDAVVQLQPFVSYAPHVKGVSFAASLFFCKAIKSKPSLTLFCFVTS
jgi:hypothetical protein